MLETNQKGKMKKKKRRKRVIKSLVRMKTVNSWKYIRETLKVANRLIHKMI
jgi:hypothetical protein